MASIWTIRRSATDAKLTGLCGGVARYWGIDPVLVRVGAVLLALSGGIGIVLYLAGWLLIPADNRPTSHLADLIPSAGRWPREAWVVVVAVICFIVFAGLGFTSPFGFGPAIVLVLIWYFGYYKNRSAKNTGTATPPSPPSPPVPPAVLYHQPGPATPFTEAADAWRQRMAEVAGHAPPSAAPRAPMPPSRAAATPPAFPLYAEAPPSDPRVADPQVAERAAFLATPDPAGLYSPVDTAPAREVATVPSRAALARTRSAKRLRLVGLVAVGLVLAGLGIADAAGVSVSVSVYLGAALLVVGLTLIAATWFGRARGILPVGLVLALALASITVLDVPNRSTQWSRTAAYTTVAELPAGCQEHEFGSLTVDLSALAVTRPTTYCAQVDGGRLSLRLPADTNVVVRYRVDAGVVVDNGETTSTGADLSGTLDQPHPDPNRPTLTIDASVAVGSLEVQR